MKRSGKHVPSGPLTVIQVIPKLDSGGAERSTLEIAQALVAAGGVAIIVTAQGRMIPAAKALGARVVTLPVASKNPFTILANARALAQLARDTQASIIHARSRAPAWSARIAARKARAAFVTTYHGLYAAKSPFKRWYNGVMAQGARVIANSTFTAHHVLAQYPQSAPRLVTIARGVDLDLFDPSKVTAARIAALRAEWGAEPGQPLILVPGRITAWKGQGDVVEALARHPALSGARLVLVGDTTSETYMRALENRIAQLGLKGRVHIAGYCADMPAAYLAANAVAQPSLKGEAFGRVAAEAQAMGAIVVASDLGGAAETVVEGTGYRYKAGDIDALGAALAFALSLPRGAKAALRAAAITHIRENFSLRKMCAETLKVYRDVLER